MDADVTVNISCVVVVGLSIVKIEVVAGAGAVVKSALIFYLKEILSLIKKSENKFILTVYCCDAVAGANAGADRGCSCDCGRS